MENQPVSQESCWVSEMPPPSLPQGWFPSDSFLLIQQNEAKSTSNKELKPKTIVQWFINSFELQVLYNLYQHSWVYEVWYVHLVHVTGLCKVGNVGMQFAVQCTSATSCPRCSPARSSPSSRDGTHETESHEVWLSRVRRSPWALLCFCHVWSGLLVAITSMYEYFHTGYASSTLHLPWQFNGLLSALKGSYVHCEFQFKWSKELVVVLHHNINEKILNRNKIFTFNESWIQNVLISVPSLTL